MATVYDINVSEKDGNCVLTCKGNLIINNIEKIYAELRDQLHFDMPLVVNIDSPEAIDITFIQLVVSLRKTYEKKGLNVSVNSKLNDDMVELIAKAGLNKELNI